MFFVAGITGRVGGAVARHLQNAGHQVRTLVRDPVKAAAWSAKGVDVRQGDFNDAASVAAALNGVDGAFLMVPPVLAPKPGFPEAQAIIDSFHKALLQATPPRLVLLSSIGSEKPIGLGLITTTHMLETALGDLPVPTACVRAGCFLENFVHGLPRVAATGVFDSFLAPVDRSVPMVGTDDIGKEAARLLSQGWSGDRKIVELGTRFSPNDVARAMSDVLGQPVTAQPIPRSKWAARLESIGMEAGTTRAYEEMWDGFNTGWIDFGLPGTEPVAIQTPPAQVLARAGGI